MKDLIAALTIFAKYGDPFSPTHCEHDVLIVTIDPSLVSSEDKVLLEDLDFFEGPEFDDCFYSYRFGSA